MDLDIYKTRDELFLWLEDPDIEKHPVFCGLLSTLLYHHVKLSREVETLKADITAQVMMERERCARIAERDVPKGVSWGPGKGIAQRIRARVDRYYSGEDRVTAKSPDKKTIERIAFAVLRSLDMQTNETHMACASTAIERELLAAADAKPCMTQREGMIRLGTIDKDVAAQLLDGHSQVTRIAAGEWSPQSIQLYVEAVSVTPKTEAKP